MSEIRDSLHGFIHLSDVERRLIDSPPMQRLKYVHQLALTYLIYPGATHSRFEHAIGTMELAGRAFDSIIRHSRGLASEVFGDDHEHGRWRATIRAAGLLHDVGHAPFSHAGDALFTGKFKNHEEMTAELIRSDPIAEILRSTGAFRLDPDEVAYVASGLGIANGQAQLVAKELIAGDLGVDRMDYLRRDSVMCGVSYGVFDLPRLVETLMLARNDDGQITLALEYGGMHAAEGLLTARFFMFSQVYFHDIRVAYDEHLIRFLKQHLPDGRYPDDPTSYLEWDDVKVLGLIREQGDDRNGAAITKRRHFRRVYELTPNDLRVDLELVDRIRDKIDAKFGEGAFVGDSRKSSKSLTVGQVLIVDPETDQNEDIMSRSTTIRALQPIWLARIYADEQNRTDVLTLVKGELPPRGHEGGES
ncbi:MAG: HD domain-containing protein [Aridibacter famidurans]|nr:HD domain-containing protein [Aridibacter famidurans]